MEKPGIVILCQDPHLGQVPTLDGETVLTAPLENAQILLRTKPVSCLIPPSTLNDQSTFPYVEGLRRHYPKIPVIVYGKGHEFSTYADAHLILLASTHLDRALKAAEQVLQERAIRHDDLDPCRQCPEPCSSLWPRRVVRYLLKDYNFLRLKSVQEVADHFGITEAYLDSRFNPDCVLTPKQMLMAQKLSYAACLRERTTLDEEAIAVRCGLRDANHLSRLFRSKVGFSFWRYAYEHRWQEVQSHFLLKCTRKNDKGPGSTLSKKRPAI